MMRPPASSQSPEAAAVVMTSSASSRSTPIAPTAIGKSIAARCNSTSPAIATCSINTTIKLVDSKFQIQNSRFNFQIQLAVDVLPEIWRSRCEQGGPISGCG